MFKGFFKKRKIKKFARKLPQDLKANYGYKEFYSQAEVDGSIRRKKLGNDSGGVIIADNCYAYAMFCSPEEFESIHEQGNEDCDYGAMRSEISDTLFNGASDFTYTSLLNESEVYTSTTSSSVNDGGGFDGGSDGGGGGGGE